MRTEDKTSKRGNERQRHSQSLRSLHSKFRTTTTRPSLLSFGIKFLYSWQDILEVCVLKTHNYTAKKGVKTLTVFNQDLFADLLPLA